MIANRVSRVQVLLWCATAFCQVFDRRERQPHRGGQGSCRRTHIVGSPYGSKVRLTLSLQKYEVPLENLASVHHHAARLAKFRK